jgi:DNA-binding NarL/FixJ family response regulator
MTATETELAGRRVLVIEDEFMVTVLIQDTLADIGCEVIGMAAHFDDAVEKIRSLSFDVAILDVNLNGRQTFAIAETLAQRGAAFVFATGYAAAALPESLQNIPIVQKPFQQRDLERALRAVLAPAR